MLLLLLLLLVTTKRLRARDRVVVVDAGATIAANSSQLSKICHGRCTMLLLLLRLLQVRWHHARSVRAIHLLMRMVLVVQLLLLLLSEHVRWHHCARPRRHVVHHVGRSVPLSRCVQSRVHLHVGGVQGVGAVCRRSGNAVGRDETLVRSVVHNLLFTRQALCCKLIGSRAAVIRTDVTDTPSLPLLCLIENTCWRHCVGTGHGWR